MGHFDYPAAHSIFQELADNNPGWLDARVNLAIATLNRQQDGDEDKALEIVTQVLARDPNHARAHYVRGLLLIYRGAMSEAEPHLRTVVEGDPADQGGFVLRPFASPSRELPEIVDFFLVS